MDGTTEPMHDPLEGVSSRGTITTGVSRERVVAAFQPVLDAATERVLAAQHDASLYLYGSVATGMAQPPRSDVDLLTIGLARSAARGIAHDLSTQFAGLCRAVEIAAAGVADFSLETDEGYGGCVFLKHYCVHLAGPDLHSALSEFAADARAARGFNGDIAHHAERWRRELRNGAASSEVGRRLARKTLLAVAGLVSVHDQTWTTDRAAAAARWAAIVPELDSDLRSLIAWSDGRNRPEPDAVEAALRGVVAQVIAAFEQSIGLWSEHGREHQSST